MKPQVLTLTGVKKAARRYYRKKRLTAQHPQEDQRKCMYRLGPYRCAIGAGLTTATINEAENEGLLGGGVVELMQKGLIRPKSYRRAWQSIQDIQRIHDWWAAAQDLEDRKRYEREFRRLIGLPFPTHKASPGCR